MRNPHALVEAPKINALYWLVDLIEDTLVVKCLWSGRPAGLRWLSRGLCFPGTNEGRQHAIEHAQAMLEAVPWMPIETAPKDGTHILAVGSYPSAIATSVHWFDGGWHLSVNRNGDDSDWGCSDLSWWRPLPSPPAGGE